MTFRIVQNELGEYAVVITSRAGDFCHLHPMESRDGFLTRKKWYDDRHVVWFRWRRTAESLIRETEKKIAKRKIEERDLAEYRRKQKSYK